MEEPFSILEYSASPQQEIITLLSQAILRKHLRERDTLPLSQNKEPARLDKGATSCLYEHTTEKTTEVDDE